MRFDRRFFLLFKKKNNKKTCCYFRSHILPSSDLVVKASSEEKTERGMHEQPACCTETTGKHLSFSCFYRLETSSSASQLEEWAIQHHWAQVTSQAATTSAQEESLQDTSSPWLTPPELSSNLSSTSKHNATATELWQPAASSKANVRSFTRVERILPIKGFLPALGITVI